VARPAAFCDADITLSDLLDTLGDTVALAADQASGSSGTALQTRFFLARLEGLAEELGRRGLIARLVAPAGRMPSLHVVNPVVGQLAEDVYVGRSQDGRWWFWWPWAERIAPGDELANAAAAIARVLGTRS
jgi:hypothetical protein